MFLPFPRRGIRAAALLAATLWPVFAAQAEAGQAKWWRSETYQRELALTAEQVTRIEHIFKESWPSLKHAKHELDRFDEELSAVIAEGTADEPRVLHLIEQVEASRSDLGRARSLMLFRIHRVLTPLQRSRLNALHEEQKRKPQDCGKTPQ